MRAMVLTRIGGPLELQELPVVEPGPHQIRLSVEACGVCRTDLHLLDGDLSETVLPIVPGHQVVGRVEAVGEAVGEPGVGQRVGVTWLGWTCGRCADCTEGRENLCARAEFTGYQRQGGFAARIVAEAAHCFALPEEIAANDLAPLLCGGLIGYRALTMAADARAVGLYGFGSAAHILAQVLRHQGRPFWVFTRSGDEASQRFARRLGAEWAGGSDQPAPQPLDAALIFAPVGDLVPKALRDVRPGGVVICAGIHMSDIPSFPYSILWGERCLRSVANLTHRDGIELLRLAAEIPIRVSSHVYPLERANDALDDLRQGRFEGSAVVVP